MNAFRKFRMLALVGLVAALLVGLAGTSAEAGGYGDGLLYTPSYQHVAYPFGLQPTYHPVYPCWPQPAFPVSCHSAYPVSYLP